MRTSLTALAVTASAAALFLGPVVASATTTGTSTGTSTSTSSSTGVLTAFGISGGDGRTLVRFRTDRPQDVRRVGRVNGLRGGDTRLVGIDYRVQDGRLYAVGDRGGIYRINTDTPRAVLVQRLTIALEGTRFGVDFNPAANALRVVSDTGQNLRQPFATPGAATVADARLTTPTPTAPTPTPTTTGVSAAAYTNNDTDPNTATTLYDINTANDTVVVQSPANAGLLAATGNLTVDAGPDAGFDIYSAVRGGTSVQQFAYATLTVDGQRRLYAVDLLTGRATSRGTLGANVTDLAIPLVQR